MNFKQNESSQKLRGGYYTPKELALFLSEWVSKNNPNKILEPSFGDGVFLKAMSKFLETKSVIEGIELDLNEFLKVKEKNISNVSVINDDFLSWYLNNPNKNNSFDAVIGNPPFIRYQYLSKEDQQFSEEIFKKHNLKFTKHTNAWVPFIVSSISLLKPGGRFAMVVPSEIIHVMHAQSLRVFLGECCKKILIIDPEEIWFEDTLQGAVMLMIEKKKNSNDLSDGLKIKQVKGNSFLKRNPDEYFLNNDFSDRELISGKWTKALLSDTEISLFEKIIEHNEVYKFSDIADVAVGIVTGANKFFLVNTDTVEKHQLAKYAHPMFGRSQHCPGVLYNNKQHEKNKENKLPTNFLWFDVESEEQLSNSASRYIKIGEKEELHRRFKCRIREPWFKVPSIYSTSIGMLKRCHNSPKLIFNEIDAYTTDTAYRIKTRDINEKKLVYCFINSFTALCAEIEGRYYGGGVLELVPSEIRSLYIPVPKETRQNLNKLDDLIMNQTRDETLAKQDQKILKSIGLSDNEINTIYGAWNRLRKRRQRNSEVD